MPPPCFLGNVSVLRGSRDMPIYYPRKIASRDRGTFG